MLQLAWTTILLFNASHLAGMTGAHHHTQLLWIEMGSQELFAWVGLEPQSS
jgi:hypothetical protein